MCVNQKIIHDISRAVRWLIFAAAVSGDDHPCVRSLALLTEAQWRYLAAPYRAQRRGLPLTPLRPFVDASAAFRILLHSWFLANQTDLTTANTRAESYRI